MTAPTLAPPTAARPAGDIASTTARGARPAAVEFRTVTRTYGSTVALAGIDLRIAPGETVALLGPNGAGKSTAISLMLGLLGPTSGSVEVLGQAPADAVRGGRIGAMLQESGLPVLARVGELVELIRGLSPSPMPTAEVLDRAGLTGLVDRRTESLSGGESQRVRFALAIAGDPDLLFLDEPTVAMDVETPARVLGRHAGLRRRGPDHPVCDALPGGGRPGRRPDRRPRSRPDRGGRHRRGHQDRCSSADPPLPARGADRDLLAALPGVEAIQLHGDGVVLDSSDPDATARALLRTDLDVRDLEIAGPDLEEAFLALTAGDR